MNDLSKILLSGKLHPPRLRNTVDRPRLKLLANIGESRLINISAGPGYGKTTLMTQLIAGYEGPRIWYQVDPMDSDPARFLRYLISGFKMCCGVGERSLKRMNDAANIDEESEDILAILLDEVEEQASTPIRLCIDDYHLIDTLEFASRFISFFAKNLPDGSTIILTSRSLPKLHLGRLRSLGLVKDIREEDLRFTFDELLTLFRQKWDIPMLEKDLNQLHQITEGWITGTILAKPHLDDEINDVQQLFYGNELRNNIYEYLAEEALENLAEKEKELLLKCSLMDVIDPDICHQAFDEDKSLYLLRILEEKNIFVSRIEGVPLYRLHPLFRSFLLDRLKESVTNVQLSALRMRLAFTYEKQGAIRDAIEQFIVTKKFETAIKLLEKNGNDLFHAGEHATLERWLDSIDNSFHTTFINILRAHIYNAQGKNLQAIKTIENIKRAKSLGDDIVFECQMVLAQCYMDMGRHKKAISELVQLLKLPLSNEDRMETLYLIGVNYWSIFDNLRVNEYCMLARSLATSSSDKELVNKADVLDGMRALHKGDFKFATKIFKEITEEHLSSASFHILYQNNLAACLIMLGQYDESLKTIEKCQEMALKHRDSRWQSLILDTYGSILLANGEYEKGMEKYDEAINYVENSETKAAIKCALICHKGTALRRNKEFFEAFTHHNMCCDIATESGEFYDLAMSMVNIGADLIRLNREKEAESYFDNAERLARKHNFNYVRTHLDFHRAWMFHSVGDKEREIQYLRSAIGRAKNYGQSHFLIQEGKIAIELFTSALANDIETGYVNEILVSIGDEASSALTTLLSHHSIKKRINVIMLLGRIGTKNASYLLRKALRDEDAQIRKYAKEKLAKIRGEVSQISELLTKRELNVLAILADGYTNREIAQQLYISEPTVKVHINRIFRKLGVNNRIEAALIFHEKIQGKNTTC